MEGKALGEMNVDKRPELGGLLEVLVISLAADGDTGSVGAAS
jgi:hypothetical protein